MNKRLKEIYLLLVILLIGFLFRFNNLNWDESHHLHPDERFLTMVGNAMVLPKNVGEYLDPKISKLNPNNIGYNFFVYGNYPLTLNKYLSVFLGNDDYNGFTLNGRQLSAFLDLLIIIIVFKIAKQLFPDKKSLPYWSALIYASSVLPIQLSHFFAVDSFLNFLMIISFYFSLKSNKSNSIQNTILAGTFFGFALASKITAVFILPLILFFLLKNNWKKSFINIFLFTLISYLFLRFANPYYFENNSFLNPLISKVYVDNINSLKNMTVKSMDNWFPPMVQWLNKNTFQHSIVNNIFFGMGIAMFLFFIVGVIKIIKSNLTIKQFNHITIILLWVLGFFFYQSLQVTPTLRYFIFLYPFFAIFAGIGIVNLFELIKQKLHNKLILNTYYLILVTVLLIWPIMFSSIYNNKNTRVEASEWIYKNLPDRSFILSESWDDGLPLPMVNNYGKQFQGEQLPVFNPDTPVKWQKMNEMLEKADYYILTSNRGWGSIPTVPEKYPEMSKFYDDLLADKNSRYIKIKEFTSYPQLTVGKIKLAVNDDWSDEGFTVYDHPKVLVFKKMK